MLIPSETIGQASVGASLSRRVNANSQLVVRRFQCAYKLIKKGEC